MKYQTNEIEDILQDEVILTANGGYQCYLVHWRGRPYSDHTGVWAEEFQYLNPDLLEEYHLRHSLKVIVSTRRELMGIQPRLGRCIGVLELDLIRNSSPFLLLVSFIISFKFFYE